jgi:hypothetical protein
MESSRHWANHAKAAPKIKTVVEVKRKDLAV